MIAGDLQYLLGIVGLEPSLANIATWSSEDRRLAAKWAVETHLRASDDDIEVPARPAFLPEPWCGPELNTGDVWDGAQATVF